VIDPAEVLRWGEWRPRPGAARDPAIPAVAGLYRIRRVGRTDLDYIGQTGMGNMTLRRRLEMLGGVYAAEMPYRDPHTAAPALWALRQSTGEEFEVSVVPVEGTTPWRMGLEALAIAVHRQEHGRSPTVEFGRVPVGYRASSGNNAKLVLAGARFRGGPWEGEELAHLPGIPPLAPLTGDPDGPGCGGHSWSLWLPIGEASRSAGDAIGLYRIRGAPDSGLLYIGQGEIGHRLRHHARKVGRVGDRQGEVFAAAPLESSWVAGGWLAHQRLELEVDLIAAHLLVTGRVPAAQFLG